MDERYGTLIDVDVEEFSQDPRTWLAKRMNEGMPWLLAHADDGVIWGELQNDGTLLLSSDIFNDPAEYPSVAVPLRAITLQQARIFGPAGEILIWRINEGFAGRTIEDGKITLEALPVEKHLLWHQGNPVKVDPQSGFALLQEGQQGQRHAPPVIPDGKRRPALKVRHYVDYDDEGQAYIALSRLVALEV
jgi:CRISPR-associated protein (TIGR03984 family)